MLLRSVVDVALETPSFGVLRLDDSLTRSSELRRGLPDLIEAHGKIGRQSDVAHDQARLGSEVGQQLVFGSGHVLTRPLGDRDRTKELVVMTDGDDPVGAV